MRSKIKCELTTLLMFMGASFSRANESQRPNVVFIAVDDLSNWVGYLGGHPQVKTPNIDRLARQGVAFTRAFSQSGMCAPSRISVMTGMQPSSTGHYFLYPSDPRNISHQSLHRYFDQFGYSTPGAGKVYHGGQNGFGQFSEIGPPEGGNPVPKEKMNILISSRAADYGAYPESDDQMGDYKVAKWAAKKLTDGLQEPFFLSAGFVRPHLPLFVPQKWFDLYPLENLDRDNSDFVPVNELSDFVRQLIYTNYDWWKWITDNGKQKEMDQAYLACISFADHCVGTVLDALAESKYASNTIVVFWSDQGWHNGDKGVYEKRTLWDEVRHVPFIIAGPGIERGRLCGRAVGLIDIYPTLVELCGLPTKEGLDGISLVPLLEDPESEWNRPVLSNRGPGMHAVRTEKWTYITYRDGYAELYDNGKDQKQRNNLARNPENREVIRELRRALPTKDLAPATADDWTPQQAQTYMKMKNLYRSFGFDIDEGFNNRKHD